MTPTDPLDERPDVVVLVDESGEDTAWAFLGTVEDAGTGYALLARLEEMESADDLPVEVVLRRYVVDDDGWESFLPINDDDVRERVEALGADLLQRGGLLPA